MARRPRLRLARSLLATPWCAAGAGIVIAAVLAVDSPTALTYGPTFPSHRCPAQGCGSASGHPPGQAATPGVVLKAPGLKGGVAAGSSGPGRATPAALLGFQVIRRWPSGFLAVITIPRAARPGPWSLRFTFRAAHVDRVWGARWQPAADGDGGTARALRPWPGAPSETRGRGAGQVTVSATGMPTSPSGCALDGLRCHFG